MNPIIQTFAEFFGFDPETLNGAMTWLGALIAVVVAIFGPIYTFLLYGRKTFLDHITYSANILEEVEGEKTLLIRTVSVLPRTDIIPVNYVLGWKLFLAIRRTKVTDVFLRLNKSDMDILQAAIISGISMVFGEGVVSRMLGLKTRKHEFFVATVFEKYGRARTQKISVMLMTEKLMKTLLEGGSDMLTKIRFERDHHVDRLSTLMQIAHQWEVEKVVNRDDLRLIRHVHVYLND